MTNIEAAMARIKQLECPTGELTKRVTGILTDYQVADINSISIVRVNALDRDGEQAYCAKLANDTEIVFRAISGDDDYVAKVTEVNIG
ncbi:hypothetical protein AXX12_04565 [Anaerosporomusa subterranea]|uniref:Uncharacterized protein n=1 Tax=Anaerosporomusa subterranea TaxID=1794912 RepID=A0A154BU54_ANASB|nr:hypothetical protein [Anaerosporomusa subterranea]KYZ77395.1 hypothetical protein AXX12_04565 [Anaerosporomusa subterranea]